MVVSGNWSELIERWKRNHTLLLRILFEKVFSPVKALLLLETLGCDLCTGLTMCGKSCGHVKGIDHYFFFLAFSWKFETVDDFPFYFYCNVFRNNCLKQKDA